MAAIVDITVRYRTQQISAISFTWGSLFTDAAGSDLWTNTWADDDAVYLPFGDGPGFSGAGVNNGLAKITGGTPTSSPAGTDVAEGTLSSGKPSTILSVGGELYVAYANPGSWSDSAANLTFSRSTNKGTTWTDATWDFTTAHGGGSDIVFNPSFLQQGKDHGQALDDYVYAYFVHYDDAVGNLGINQGGKIGLIRCDISGGALAITGGGAAPGNWEYLASTAPTWSSDKADAIALITDATNGVQLVSGATRMPDLNSILLGYHHGGTTKNDSNHSNLVWAVADHDKPWGPFTEVARYDQSTVFGPGDGSLRTLTTLDSVEKWRSGTSFVMVGSGVDSGGFFYDRYVQLEGTFTVS